MASTTISPIPLDHPLLLRARALIPTPLWQTSWVAGSAATRFPQNKDVDVWVCNVPQGVSPDSVITGGRLFASVTQETHDGEYDHLSWRAIDEDGLQIMVGHESIQEVLGRFDISCHAAALNLVTGEVLRGLEYSDDLKVINFQIAITTITRYLRFAERYGDWTGLTASITMRCAAAAFNLFTYEEMKEEYRYLKMDKDL